MCTRFITKLDLCEIYATASILVSISCMSITGPFLYDEARTPEL